MTKQQIEIDIPEGMAIESQANYIETTENIGVKLKLRPIEKWRVPTKLDLLNRDSIECRWRDSDAGEWRHGTVVAIRTPGHFYIASHSKWCWYCEIRDTEPKPHEIWVCRIDGRTLSQAYKVKAEAMKDCWSDDTKVVRFVEVPE